MLPVIASAMSLPRRRPRTYRDAPTTSCTPTRCRRRSPTWCRSARSYSVAAGASTASAPSVFADGWKLQPDVATSTAKRSLDITTSLHDHTPPAVADVRRSRSHSTWSTPRTISRLPAISCENVLAVENAGTGRASSIAMTDALRGCRIEQRELAEDLLVAELAELRVAVEHARTRPADHDVHALADIALREHHGPRPRGTRPPRTAPPSRHEHVLRRLREHRDRLQHEDFFRSAACRRPSRSGSRAAARGASAERVRSQRGSRAATACSCASAASTGCGKRARTACAGGPRSAQRRRRAASPARAPRASSIRSSTSCAYARLSFAPRAMFAATRRTADADRGGHASSANTRWPAAATSASSAPRRIRVGRAAQTGVRTPLRSRCAPSVHAASRTSSWTSATSAARSASRAT